MIFWLNDYLWEDLVLSATKRLFSPSLLETEGMS